MIGCVFLNGKKMFVLDTKGKDALVVFPGEYIVCIIAHDYAVDKNKKISWDYGDYFLEISEACKKFYSKRINYYDKHIRRWCYIIEMNENNIYCYGKATSEDGNFKVVFEDDEQRKNYEDLFGEV